MSGKELVLEDWERRYCPESYEWNENCYERVTYEEHIVACVNKEVMDLFKEFLGKELDEPVKELDEIICNNKAEHEVYSRDSRSGENFIARFTSVKYRCPNGKIFLVKKISGSYIDGWSEDNCERKITYIAYR